MENPVKEGSMTWELAYLKLRQQNLEAEKEIQLLVKPSSYLSILTTSL